MNTATASTASVPRTEKRGYFARLLRTLRTELRRGLEFTGAAYANGVPPLL